MTTEEKAKAYDEALERARIWKDKSGMPKDKRGILDEIFLELAESEDEKIRKEIINYFQCQSEEEPTRKEIHNKWIAWLEKQGEPQDKGEISDGYHTFNELYNYRMLYNASFFNLLPKEWVHKSKKHHNGEECFGGGWFIVMANLPTGQISNHYELKDWDLFHIQEKEVADEWDGHTPQEAAERLHKYLLEKQGEQKPMDKVEPKFRNGQWIIWQDKCYKVNYDGCGYELVDQNGLSTSLEYGTVDENAHLWDITRDAKDGDVLTCYSDIKGQPIEQTGIIKQYVGRHGGCSNSFKAHFGVDWDNNVVIEGYMGSSNIYPSTKEQRELLFKKMKEARYEWDAETKELKELEEISGNQGGISPATEETVRKNLQDNDFRRMFEMRVKYYE